MQLQAELQLQTYCNWKGRGAWGAYYMYIYMEVIAYEGDRVIEIENLGARFRIRRVDMHALIEFPHTPRAYSHLQLR